MPRKKMPEKFISIPKGLNSLLTPALDPKQIAAMALPLFGGTQPATVVVAPAGGEVTPPDPTPTATPDPTSGGEPPKEDPIAKLASDPNALGQLLAQVDSLTKNLTKVTQERDGYVTKQQEEARKTQTREQQLESDLAQRDQVIQQMDSVIRNMAIGNAILSQKDVQWHSLKQVLAELNPESFEIDVDLSAGNATVTGVDSEVKRIARECPWLVAKSNDPGTGSRTPQRTPVGSGAPPVGPVGDATKATKRADLMKKFPVISHGRRG
jgi:hypothetical protein